jgi:hypothetical protein
VSGFVLVANSWVNTVQWARQSTAAERMRSTYRSKAFASIALLPSLSGLNLTLLMP